MRVAVIGAGAAGLCAARHVSCLAGLEQLVVYEQSENVGGVWVYSDQTGLDPHGLPIHSAIYKNMKTNLPKEIMGFPDYPFPDEVPESFVSHTVVRTYLENYEKHFHLKQFIRFSTCVRDVIRCITAESPGGSSWLVTLEDVDSKKQLQEWFDAIFVCNGHHYIPYIPSVPGMDTFSGTILHSHDYRIPERFAGLRVACMGAGPSGIDIALELNEVCSKVFLCHRKDKIRSQFPQNIDQRSGFVRFCPGNSGEIELENGDRIQVDVVIFCTGYYYEYPFLKGSFGDRLVANCSGVRPLFQHMVHIQEPTLFFIGLTDHFVPFPNFDTQVRYAVSILSGHAHLPPREEMYAWEENNCKQQKHNPVTSRRIILHFLFNKQWDYIKTLCELGKMPNRVPSVVQHIYEETHRSRNQNIVDYKSLCFKVLDTDNFQKNTTP